MFNVGKLNLSMLFWGALLAFIGIVVIGGYTDELLNKVSPGMGDGFNQGAKTLEGAGKNFCGEAMDKVFDVEPICELPGEIAKEAQQAGNDLEQTGRNASNLFSRWWNETTSWWKDKLK